jgi:hypothetical protein
MSFKKIIKKVIKRFIPRQHVKVSLFVVGAQKAGTSALHDYLIKHPSVTGGIIKELNYFNHSEKYAQGTQWYHDQFKAPLFYKSKKIYIDSTPQYLSTTDVAQKIYAYNPKAKIVILLREPVSRAYSAWNMYQQFSKLSAERKAGLIDSHISNKDKNKFNDLINQTPFPSFDDYINKEIIDGSLTNHYPQIIKRGIYADQIKPYINVFDLDNVLVFESNYFKTNKVKVTNKVLNNFGMSNLEIDFANLKSINKRKYDKSISKLTEDRLKAFYKPHNERLFNLINQKFNWE